MSPSKRFLVHLLLILSGTASLIYEIIWTRVLQYTFGNTDLSVTTVLAVFMGGLALGAWIGGRYAHRFRYPIVAYGVLEFIIALYALGVTPLLYHLDFLYSITGANASAGLLTLLRFAASAVLLIIPTVCMGATLPLLTVPLVKLDRAGEGVGLLYFVNTLGAVCGSAVAGFALIRFLGLSTSLVVAACLGTLVMLLAVLLNRGIAPSTEENGVAAAAVAQKPVVALGSLAVLSPSAGSVLILIIAGLCGYVSLVNEVVWTRMLGFLLDGTVYGFSALLSSFLLGIALGSLIISPFIDDSTDLWGLFAKVQLFAAIGCIFTILLIPMVPSLVDAFLGAGTGVEGGFALKVFIVFLIILFPCLFFGAAFPICVTIASRYRGEVSTSMGSVYAANTVGSILGSISGGMVLLPITKDLNTILIIMVFLSLGMAATTGGLASLAYLRGAAAAVGERRGALMQAAVAKGIGLLALPLVIFVCVGAAWPDVNIYQLVCTRYAVEDYDRSLGYSVSQVKKQAEKIIWKAQGNVTVVTVHRLKDKGLRLRNNGLNEAYHGITEPRYADVIFYLGIMPYLWHPNPQTALLIGLGGGGTAECLTKTDLKSLTVVELEREVVNASRFIYRKLTGKKEHPLDDPRVKLQVDDGRNALLRAAKAKPHQFDLIVSQPSHAWLSGVASLYTEEHFGIVRRNLRKGGIFCQWINLFRMDEVGLGALMRAFTAAFPVMHVFQVDSNSLLLLGGDEGFRLDPNVVKKHLSEGRLKAQASLFSVEATTIFRKYMFGRQTALALAKNQPMNSDRFPVIEMRLPWVLHNDTVKIRKLLDRRSLAWGVQPDLVHRSAGWEDFLVSLTEDMVAEYDSDKLPFARVNAFVDRAATLLGPKGIMPRARLARIAGDWLAALELYRQAAARGDVEAQVQIGKLQLKLRRYDEAAKQCGETYVKTKRTDAHLCAAEAKLQAGKWAEARAVLEAMVGRKEHEELTAVEKHLGLLEFQQGRYEKAREHLLAHYQHNSSDEDTPYFLGLLEAMAGRQGEAKRYLASWVANNQTMADVASREGKRFAERDHQFAAATKFQETLRLRRDLGDAYKWMATALHRWARFGDVSDVIDAFSKQDSSAALALRAQLSNSASISQRIAQILWSNCKDWAP